MYIYPSRVGVYLLFSDKYNDLPLSDNSDCRISIADGMEVKSLHSW